MSDGRDPFANYGQQPQPSPMPTPNQPQPYDPFGNYGAQMQAPQAAAPPPLQGDISQSVYADRGPDMFKNAVLDAETFKETTAGLWNLGQLRGREAFVGDRPMAQKTPQNQIMDAAANVLLGPMGGFVSGAVQGAYTGDASQGKRPLYRPAEDFQAFTQALDDAAGYYRNEYGTPATQHPGSFLPYLGEHFQKAPLATMLDLGGFAIGGAGMDMAKSVGPKIAARFPAVGKAAGAVSGGINFVAGKFANMLPEGLQLSVLPEWMQALTPAGQAQQYVLNTLKDIDLDRLEEVIAAKKELDAAFAELHKEANPRTFAAGIEFTDREARKVITKAMNDETYGSPVIKRAVAAVRKYNKKMQTVLQIPDDDVLKAAHGGQYIAVINRLRKASIQKLGKELQELERVQKYRSSGPAQPIKGAITKEQVPHPKLPGETYDRVRIAGRPPFKEEIKRFVNKTDAEIQKRRDYIRAAMKDNRLLRFEDLDDGSPHFKALQRMAARMDKAGTEKPTYVPVVHQLEAAINEGKTFAEPFGGIKPGGKTATAKLAKKVGRGEYSSGFDAPANERPGFMQPREKVTTTYQPAGKSGGKQQSIRKPYHELRTQKATLDRVYRTAQFTALQRFFKALLEMKVEAKGNWVDINLRDELAAAAKATGASSRAVDETFRRFKGADTVSLPPQVAAIVRRNLLRQPGDNNVFRQSGSFMNKWLFGGDPMFGPRLALQTAAVEGVAMKGPKDFAALVLAHVIASDPEAERLFPPAVILSSKHTLQDSLLEIKDPQLARASQNWIDRMIQKKSDLDYRVHDYQRRAFAIHYLLYRAQGASPTIKRLIADALDIDSQLEKAADISHAEMPALQARIKKFLGDYSSLTAAGRQKMRDIFPIAQWGYHAYDLLKSVPVEAPVKVSITNALQGFIKRYQDDEQDEFSKQRGQVRMTTAEGEPMTGPNGGQKYFGGYHVDPLESGFAMTLDLGELIFNVGHEMEFPAGINPIATGIEAIKGNDPRTGKPYRDYSLAKSGDQQIDPKTKEVKKRVTPVAPLILAEEAMPKQTAAMQRLVGLVNGTMPSRLTYPGNPAPKTDNKQQPYKADPVEVWLQMVGLGASEMLIAPEDRAQMDQRRSNRNSKAVRRFNLNTEEAQPPMPGYDVPFGAPMPNELREPPPMEPPVRRNAPPMEAPVRRQPPPTLEPRARRNPPPLIEPRHQQYGAKPGPYETKLSPLEERAFRKWVDDTQAPFIADDPGMDYDMRGFWKALMRGDKTARSAVDERDGRLHYPDKWKKPHHPLFSNESIYATKDAPHWKDDRYLIDSFNNVLFDAGAANGQ